MGRERGDMPSVKAFLDSQSQTSTHLLKVIHAEHDIGIHDVRYLAFLVHSAIQKQAIKIIPLQQLYIRNWLLPT